MVMTEYHYEDLGWGVEVGPTRNAGWGWHCSACPVTKLNLDEGEARRGAASHLIAPAHRQKVARG